MALWNVPLLGLVGYFSDAMHVTTITVEGPDVLFQPHQGDPYFMLFLYVLAITKCTRKKKPHNAPE